MSEILIPSVFSNAEIFNARTYRLLIDKNLAPSLANAIAGDPIMCRCILGDLMPGLPVSRRGRRA